MARTLAGSARIASVPCLLSTRCEDCTTASPSPTACWCTPSRRLNADGHRHRLARSASAPSRSERAGRPAPDADRPVGDRVEIAGSKPGGRAYAQGESLSFALGRPQMAHRRNIATAVLVAALVLGAASCGGDEDPGNDPGAQPTPTTSATTSATPTPTPTESTSPTPDPEAWRAEFTQGTAHRLRPRTAGLEAVQRAQRGVLPRTAAGLGDGPQDLRAVHLQRRGPVRQSTSTPSWTAALRVADSAGADLLHGPEDHPRPPG